MMRVGICCAGGVRAKYSKTAFSFAPPCVSCTMLEHYNVLFGQVLWRKPITTLKNSNIPGWHLKIM